MVFQGLHCITIIPQPSEKIGNIKQDLNDRFILYSCNKRLFTNDVSAEGGGGGLSGMLMVVTII